MKYLLPVLLLIYGYCPKAQEIQLKDTTIKTKYRTNPVWGTGITVSSFGTGAVLYRDITKNLRLKGSASYIFYNYSLHKLISDLQGIANIRIGGLGIYSDWFLGRQIFISGGISTNFNRLNVSGKMAESIMIGDVEMTPDDIGSVTISIKPAWPVSPYFGFGIGKKISHAKKWGYSLEIGTFLQGAPQVHLAATGMLTPTASEEQEKIMENNIKPIDFWPKIGINVTYKINWNDQKKLVH